MIKSETKNGLKIRQKYSPQFKDQALELVKQANVPQEAKDLGIAESGISIENQKFSKLRCLV